VKNLTQTYLIETSPEEVFKALTTPEIIEEWSGSSPVKMEANVGTEFSLWGGDIHGKNIEIIPNRKIVQEWYGGNWSEPSIVTFELSSINEGTIVELEQKNIPDEAFEGIAKGWEDYYLGQIQEMFAPDEGGEE